MAIEKVIDINIQSNADEKILTLKQQLKAAKAEVIALSDAFGLTSQEAIQAAERAAELSHEIANANKLVKTFNPSATLNSTTTALGSVKEGFEVAASSLHTFGFESKGLEGTLGKLGVAMELTQGVTAIQESATAYRNLGATLKSYSIVQKLITAGQWLWNTAIMANPIGAIIIAITGLIAAGVALTNYFKASAAESERNTKAVKNNEKALESQSKTLERNSSEFQKKQNQELAMAKASGASADSIRALELKLIDEKIAYEKSARAVAFNTYEKNKNYLASLKAADADEEIIKKQQETTNKSILEYNKQNQNVQKAFDERKDIQNRHQIEVRQSQTDDNKKAREENYKNQKEDLEEKLTNDKLSFNQRRELVKKSGFLEANDRKDLLKQINADEVKFKKEQEEEKIKKEQEFAKTLRDKQIEEGYKSFDEIAAATKANEEALMSKKDIALKQEEEDYRIKKERAILSGNSIVELEKEFNRNIKKIKDDSRLEDDAKKATELEKQISDQSLSFEARLSAVDAEQALFQKQIDDQVITEEQYNEKVKVLAKSREEIAKQEAAAKAALFAKTSETLNKGADLLGKNTAAGKAMAAAAALINTYQGISAELATKTTTPFEIGLKIANVAIIAATGFKSVQDIISTPIPGEGGGGGGGATAPSGGGGMTAPSFNIVGPSGPNQIAESIANQNQQPLQAYVVSGAVTTSQALNRNIINNASIG